MKKMSLLVAVVIVFLFSFTRTYAQEESSLTSKRLSQQAQNIDYQLPYPGILPDSPFYSLKIVRDRIIDFLITDPQKKAQFYILSADKHLNAGIYLFNNNEIDLAETTISKGENYFEKALGKVREFKQQQGETADLTRKISLSLKIHKKSLIAMKNKSPKNFKEKFIFLEKRINEFEKQADSLMSQ